MFVIFDTFKQVVSDFNVLTIALGIHLFTIAKTVWLLY